MTDPAERQRQFNRQTFDNRETASAHRKIVTDLVLEGCAGVEAPRICVLGAGNLNDLELAPLVERGARLTLVDLDGEALAAGAARQGFSEHPSVALAPGINLSPLLARLSEGAASVADDEWVPLAGGGPTTSPGQDYDLVVSTCLLSQLTFGLVEVLPPTEPRFLEVLIALRRAHVRLMSDLCRPGGTVLLVADVVSSDTVPGLADRRREELPGLLAVLVAQRNFFHGMNPLALMAMLSGDPEVAPRWGALQVIPPWIWRLGPRAFLVCAFAARRAG